MVDDLLNFIQARSTKKIHFIDLDSTTLCEVNQINDWIINHSPVNNCDLIIIDYSYKYNRFIDEWLLYSIIDDLNLKWPWIIITSNFNYFRSNNNQIIYYPIHAIHAIEYPGNNIDIDLKSKRDYLVSVLSHHLHPHRLLLLTKLYEQPWFDKCLINFSTSNITELQTLIYQSSLRLLTADELSIIQQIQNQSPIIADPFESCDSIVSINNRGFTNCYISMFTEANYNSPFITEKSIKPFMSGQFNAVFGADGLVDHLNELGFEPLDNYLNLAIQTNISDPLTSLRNLLEEIIVNQISKLVDNIEQVWNDTYQIRKYNYELVRSIEFKYTLQRSLQEAIE